MLERLRHRSMLWAVLLQLLLAVRCQTDHGIAPHHSGVSGTINYVGEWPESTEEVVLVASTSYPPESLADLVLSEPLPIGVSEHRYHFDLPSGTYRLIGVAWRERGKPWDIDSLVGLYLVEGSSQPDSVVLATDDSQVTGVDITVDFSRGRIVGRVTFLGEWPGSTEEVRVAAYATYPPTSFFDIRGYSDPFPLGVSAHDYSMSLLPGTYEWVIVVWREKETFWGPESFLGMYRAATDSTRPGQVLVQQGKVSTGIDITADFSRRGVLPPEVEEILGR